MSCDLFCKFIGSVQRSVRLYFVLIQCICPIDILSNFLKSVFTAIMIYVKELHAIDTVLVSFEFGLDCFGLFQRFQNIINCIVACKMNVEFAFLSKEILAVLFLCSSLELYFKLKYCSRK